MAIVKFTYGLSTTGNIVPEFPRVGDYIYDRKDGKKWKITSFNGPAIWMTHTYTIDGIEYRIPHYVLAIDIWNYYSMWPGTNDPPIVEKRHCEHKIVNVSFNRINMRCKFCDKSEDECKAETESKKGEDEYVQW